MPNTTTPASVASRLTDEEIGDLAELQDELGNSSTSSILRDYVRLRNLNGELRKCLKDATDSEEENAKLKARMVAVVKMLEEKERATSCSDCGRYNGYPCADHDECGLFKHHEEFTAILRVARGEGGAE